MSQFKVFANDWLDIEPVLNQYSVQEGKILLNVNLEENFFNEISFDKKSLRQYRIEAARSCAEGLGDNIALCFSGGIDSQAMLQCFIEADIPFTLYTLQFNEDFNIQDVMFARYIANKIYKIKLNEIPLNILSFLTRENFEYGQKYKSISPHFNTHYKMFDILKSMGHTGIVCGGQTIINNNNEWGINFTRNPFNFINYNEISNSRVQGSFLSHYPKLTWAVSILTKNYNLDFESAGYVILNKEHYNQIGYGLKVNAYIKAGFEIVSQCRKYTGFELVKKYYELKHNDVNFFEKQFRIPLSTYLKIGDNHVNFNLTDENIKKLSLLQSLHDPQKFILKNHETIRKSYFKKYLDIYNMRPW